jgi:Domain of unknown function (DUF6532)
LADPQCRSRSSSIQAGEKRPRSDDSDSEIEEIAVHKALKINEKSSRPKAGDYDDVAKEVILLAATAYRCLLSTNNGFPELAAETELVKLAWDDANKESGMRPLKLTPNIAKIVSHSGCHFLWFCFKTYSFSCVYQIKARGSQTRGEAKEKTKLFVETMYGFESGRSKKAIAANRKLAEELKQEKGFIYEVSLLFIYFGVSYLNFARFYLVETVFERGCITTPSSRRPSTQCGFKINVTKVFVSRKCLNLSQFKLLLLSWLLYVILFFYHFNF